MGRFALAIAVVAVVLAVLPNPGMFAGMGAAVLALTLGVAGYRRRSDPGFERLGSAAGIAIGALALVISMVRYAATLAAVGKLEQFF